jgi:hypothetical protein
MLCQTRLPRGTQLRLGKLTVMASVRRPSESDRQLHAQQQPSGAVFNYRAVTPFASNRATSQRLMNFCASSSKRACHVGESTHSVGISVGAALSHHRHEPGVGRKSDLRILGLAPDVRLSPLERFFPVLWTGFWINALTGVLLLMQDATTKLTNPAFYVKMLFIAFAIVNLRMIRARIFGNPRIDDEPLSRHAKVLAATSLFLWLGAITAGRLLAYIGPVSGFD